MNQLKNTILCVLLLSPINAFCGEGAHTGAHHAPIHVDTTPDLNDNGEITTTLESNIYQGTTYLSPSIAISTKNGWDVGISTYNIPVQGGGMQNFEFDTYLILSKTFKLDDKTLWVIGSQNGTTLLANSNRQWHSIEFSILNYQITSFLSIYMGPYYANANLTTTANIVGYTNGFNLKLIPNKLNLTGDYFSGRTNASGGVVKLNWNVTPTVQLYTGVIVPETNSGNEFAGIFGVSLSIY